MKNKPKLKHKSWNFNFVWIIVLIVLYWCYKNVTSSVFLKSPDKINLIFYGKTTRYYSIDRKGLDYFLSIPSDARLLVPGGYGYYRSGALNKLATLEKKPDLIRKTYSVATSSMVDLYFYPPEGTIFYKQSDEGKFSPTFYEIALNPGNANLVDRLFILGSLLGKNKNSYKVLELPSSFTHESFIEDHMGIFYKRSYRNSQLNVQIAYFESFGTAKIVGQILDGEGIRVVDLTKNNYSFDKQCEIIAPREVVGSDVVNGMKNFFGCRVKTGDVAVSDIILKLGKLEKDWAAK